MAEKSNYCVNTVRGVVELVEILAPTPLHPKLLAPSSSSHPRHLPAVTGGIDSLFHPPSEAEMPSKQYADRNVLGFEIRGVGCAWWALSGARGKLSTQTHIV